MPQHVVLINQKLGGYWEITQDNFDQHPENLIRIVKFDKCKKADRKAKSCSLTWMYVDSSSIHKKKLSKEIKKNWEPDGERAYWVERKRDKETKLPIIHIDETSSISIELIKKEYSISLDSVVVQQARKLK